jgi:hypothetical protein
VGKEDNCIGYVHQSEKCALVVFQGGKGAHLFIIDPNLSMDLNKVYMKLYIKRNLKCGANARNKNTTYETRSFNMKILQHPQWKGQRGATIVLLFIIIVFIKKELLGCMQFFLKPIKQETNLIY